MTIFRRHVNTQICVNGCWNEVREPYQRERNGFVESYDCLYPVDTRHMEQKENDE